jgi:hypothetical protein
LNVPGCSLKGNPSGINQTIFGFFFVLIVNISGVIKYAGSLHAHLLCKKLQNDFIDGSCEEETKIVDPTELLDVWLSE